MHEEYQYWLTNIARDAGLETQITLAAIEGKAREAPNRNRGWSLVKTRYTAFLDADDVYSNGRLTLLEETANMTNAALLLNELSLSREDLLDARNFTVQDFLDKLINAEPIRSTTFGNDLFPFHWENFDGKNPTSLKIPAEFGKVEIPHAHSFVLTKLRDEVTYRDIYPGSDGLFCQEVLARQANVYIVPLKLSAWINQRSAYAHSRPLYVRLLSKVKSFIKGLA